MQSTFLVSTLKPHLPQKLPWFLWLLLNHIPRNLADETCSIGWLLSCMETSENGSFLVKMAMNLVLAALAVRWLLLNQLWMILISDWKSDKSIDWEIGLLRVVSSPTRQANSHWKNYTGNGHSHKWQKVGPQVRDLWNTRENGNGRKLTPWTATRWDRSERYDLNHNSGFWDFFHF